MAGFANAFQGTPRGRNSCCNTLVAQGVVVRQTRPFAAQLWPQCASVVFSTRSKADFPKRVHRRMKNTEPICARWKPSHSYTVFYRNVFIESFGWVPMGETPFNTRPINFEGIDVQYGINTWKSHVSVLFTRLKPLRIWKHKSLPKWMPSNEKKKTRIGKKSKNESCITNIRANVASNLRKSHWKRKCVWLCAWGDFQNVHIT